MIIYDCKITVFLPITQILRLKQAKKCVQFVGIRHISIIFSRLYPFVFTLSIHSRGVLPVYSLNTL